MHVRSVLLPSRQACIPRVRPRARSRPRQVMEFPVVMLVRFWANHHLLDILQRPLWRVVRGRSRAYVERIVAGALPAPLQ